jgi:DNA-nicking Smr family endonuclease
MKELDKRAANITFKENNKNRKEGGKIDLHGLYVAEAVQFSKDQAQIARSRGDEVVRFIVGKGLHSDAGEAKIRPALEDHFNKRGLNHSLDPRNAGVLIVRLD